MGLGFGIIGCGMIANFHARAIADVRGCPARGLLRHGSRPRPTSWPPQPAARPTTTSDEMLADPDVRGGDDRHAQRGTPGAGRGRRAGGQARDRREAAGNHARALRRDHRGVRQSGRRAVDHLSLAVSRVAQLIKRAIDEGRFGRLTVGDAYREVVSHAAVLRQRRLARHLGARRRRSPDEPGDPQRRPARPG